MLAVNFPCSWVGVGFLTRPVCWRLARGFYLDLTDWEREHVSSHFRGLRESPLFFRQKLRFAEHNQPLCESIIQTYFQHHFLNSEPSEDRTELN